MWGDYGYIEEGFERSYDFRLLWRFFRYARPYSWLIALICLLILAATATELVLPYLTKTSLDRYIVASARKVNLDAAREPGLKILVDRYNPLFLDSGQSGLFFLPGDRTGRIDAGDFRRLEQAGVIQSEPFYLTDPNRDGMASVLSRNGALFQVFPKAAVIAVSDLKKLDRPDLMRLRDGDIRGLASIALVCVMVLVIGYLFNVAQVVLLEYVGQRITHDLRQDLLTHVINQSIAFHDRHSKGRLVARLTNDIQNLNEMVTNVAVTFFKDIFILAGIVAMMLYLNLQLALIAFALLPVVALVTDIFRRRAREVYRELRKKVGQINASFAETIAGIQIIQAFRREEDNNRRFVHLNHDNFVAGYRQIRLFAIFMPLVELASAISLALIIWYGGLNVLRDAITIGVVVAFVAYSQKLYQPIRELSEKFNILQSSLASLERIFMLRDQQSALPEALVPQTATRGPGHIRFDQVNFSYTHGEEILKDISFEVKPGETLAIVGPTGAGKTSIINLLLRFYDPESGGIFIDGQDIRGLDLSSHRSRIGLVMQDVFIFAGSVRENIALSRTGFSQERIEAAAEAVGADSFIRTLPDGYDQPLGEGGRSLSVGQRQLLSFARVLAFDPQILILDEATAFIDSESEKLIESAVRRLIQGRTSIVIAHRLSTIRRADKILVLSHGRIAEFGNHEELLAAQGLYYRLYQLQFNENGL